MSNLKLLRNRVKSIKSTQKITKAMQMVAASKLRKFKDKLSKSEDYLSIVNNIMSNIVSANDLGNFTEEEKKYFQNIEITKPVCLFVVFSSERGLCGSFNSSILKQLKQDIFINEENNKEVKIIIIGKKGYDILKTKYIKNIDSFVNIDKNNEKIIAIQIKNRIMNLIAQGQISDCVIYFNKFKNAMTQVLVKQQILPVKPLTLFESSKNENSNIEYEGEGLVLNLINLYITGHLNFSLLQSRASEEGARMSAMDNATKNAKELINQLTLKLNRTRQTIITNELIEIISGAETI